MQAAALNLNEMNHWEQLAERAKIQVPVWYVGDVQAVINAREAFETAEKRSLEKAFRPGAYVAGALSVIALGAGIAAGLVADTVAQANIFSVAAGMVGAAAVMGGVVLRDSRARETAQNAALTLALEAFGKGLANMDSKAQIEPTVREIKRAESSPDAFERALAAAALAPNQLYKKIVDRQQQKIKQEQERQASMVPETPEEVAKRAQETLNSIREKSKERKLREKETDREVLASVKAPADAPTTTARRRMGMR